MASFLSRIQCLIEDNTVSAQKAVDYYEGDQTRLLEQLLSTKGRGIKNWYDRGVIPIWDNYTKKVIERSAHTYDQQPQRKIEMNGEEDEAQTELYDSILTDAGFQFASQSLDELSRLLKSTLLLIQWVEETQRYNLVALGRHNSDIEWDSHTGTVKSIMYVTCDAGLNGGQMFRVITPETITDIEFIAATGDAVARVRHGDSSPNPYGIVTAAPLFDTRPPTSGFYAKPAWEELICFNEAINMFNTEVKHGSRYGLLGMPVTNATITKDTVMGVDALVQVEQENPDIPIFFEFRAPQIQVEEFLTWLKMLANSIGQNWGISLEADGNGATDSGFKLIVKEIPNVEMRLTRQKAAIPFEKSVFNIIRTMHRIDSPSKPQFKDEAKIDVEFTAPLLPVNKAEETDRRQKRLAAGTLSRLRAIMEENPNWTRVEAEEELALIDAERKVTVIAPNFEE